MALHSSTKLQRPAGTRGQVGRCALPPTPSRGVAPFQASKLDGSLKNPPVSVRQHIILKFCSLLPCRARKGTLCAACHQVSALRGPDVSLERGQQGNGLGGQQGRGQQGRVRGQQGRGLGGQQGRDRGQQGRGLGRLCPPCWPSHHTGQADVTPPPPLSLPSPVHSTANSTVAVAPSPAAAAKAKLIEGKPHTHTHTHTVHTQCNVPVW